MVRKKFFVYIMTTKNNRVLYTGVTSDIQGRVQQHIEGQSIFTKHYMVNKLVYYEECEDPVSAIAREKQIKSRSRAFKVKLIESLNPEWKDLIFDL